MRIYLAVGALGSMYLMSFSVAASVTFSEFKKSTDRLIQDKQ